jgi:hypothetical protein
MVPSMCGTREVLVCFVLQNLLHIYIHGSPRKMSASIPLATIYFTHLEPWILHTQMHPNTYHTNHMAKNLPAWRCRLWGRRHANHYYETPRVSIYGCIQDCGIPALQPLCRCFCSSIFIFAASITVIATIRNVQICATGMLVGVSRGKVMLITTRL